MSDQTERKGWVVSVEGEDGSPESDRLYVTRYDPPMIQLRIDAPGIRLAGDQQDIGRKAIQESIAALQGALNTDSALPGFGKAS